MRKDVATRFWGKVNKHGPVPAHRPELGPCWVWTASTHHEWGYGHFRVDGGNRAAHRVSWEMHYGPIHGGGLACHRCDNPPCVRPSHLFLGSSADNAADREAKGRGRAGIVNASKTHCPHGHEYTPENTHVRHDPRCWTMRFCRECNKTRCRKAYARDRVKRVAQATEASRARRERHPEAFKRRQRDYMRERRARQREAAKHLPRPPD